MGSRIASDVPAAVAGARHVVRVDEPDDAAVVSLQEVAEAVEGHVPRVRVRRGEAGIEIDDLLPLEPDLAG